MFSKKSRAIARMLKQGKKEIMNAEIMIDFYQWQINNAPEDMPKEELAKLELKIKQMEDITANNTHLNNAFLAFLKS